MNQPNHTKPLFNYWKYQTPNYQHRVWMNGCEFTMKGKKYRIVCGTILCKDGKCYDAIRFEEVPPPQESDYPIQVFLMPEQEFFSKVNSSQF